MWILVYAFFSMKLCVKSDTSTHVCDQCNMSILTWMYSQFPRRWDSKWSSKRQTKSKSASRNNRSRSLFIWKFEKRPGRIVSWFRFGFRFAFRWRCRVWCKSSDTFRVLSAEYRLFYRVLLQKRPIISRSLLVIATPYRVSSSRELAVYSCKNTYVYIGHKHVLTWRFHEQLHGKYAYTNIYMSTYIFVSSSRERAEVYTSEDVYLSRSRWWTWIWKHVFVTHMSINDMNLSIY